MPKFISYLEKTERIIFILALVLFPLVLFPNIVSPFDTPKMLLWLGAVILIYLVCSVKMVSRGVWSFKTSNLDLPVALLALTYVLSAVIKTPNKIEAFFQPGVASLFVLGAIIFVLANSLFSENKKSLTTALFFTGVVAAVVSLITVSGFLTKLSFLPAFLKDTNFSPFGGKLPEAIFLAVILPLGVTALLKEKGSVNKFFYGACLGVVTLAMALSIYKVLPGKAASPLFPPYGVSWSIAVDSLKESPLWGSGSGNYLTAFNRLRPVSFNTDPLWSYKFTAAKSFLLTNLTETGLIGFAVLIFLLFRTLKVSKKDPLVVSVGVAIVSLVLFPAYITSVLVFFVLLSLVATKKEVNLNLRLAGDSPVAAKIPAVILAVILVGIFLTAGYFAGRYTLAEYKFAQALASVSQNDVKTAYADMAKAIALNPRVDRYHASLSQMDIAVTASLAQKKSLTDQDKTAITQSIQAAIAEGKNAVVLNPQRSGNWQNLATIYRAIMPFAQGADNFTVQAYTQAVALDPIDPNLRIAQGGVYFALGRYDEAISAFQLATFAKPNLANAHYNLSAAYKQKGDIQKAVDEMNTVLTLVSSDSNDYKTAKTELDALNKNLPAKTATTTNGTLTSPPAATKAVITPPLELPQEATPPAAP